MHGKKHIEEVVSIRREARCLDAKNLRRPGQSRAHEAVIWQAGSVPASGQEKTMIG